MFQDMKLWKFKVEGKSGENILGYLQGGNFRFKIIPPDIPSTLNFHTFIYWNIFITGRNALVNTFFHILEHFYHRSKRVGEYRQMFLKYFHSFSCIFLSISSFYNMHVCVSVCMHTCVFIFISLSLTLSVYIYTCMYAHRKIDACVCVYTCIYMYTYVNTPKDTQI